MADPMERIKLMVTIVDREKTARAAEMFSAAGAGADAMLHYASPGLGTANSDLLDYLGLGETGNREDCPLIGNFLGHPQPTVVRAAMTALMRLDPEKYISAVTEQLATDQPGVVKTAALLLAKHRDFDQDRVFAIQQATSVENTKLKCAVLLFRTGKWDRLTYALTLLGGGYEKLDQACRLELMAWIHTYNRSYAPLGEEQRRRILALLDEKGAYLHPAVVNQLRFLSK